MSSIRQRLLVVLLAIMSLGWLVMAVAGYYSAKREVEELFDAQLAQSSRVLQALINQQQDEKNNYRRPGGRITLDYDQPGHLYESRIAFRVLNQANAVLLQSDSFPDTQPTPLNPGFGDLTIDKNRWRYFVLYDPNLKISLEVTQHYQPREELIADIVFNSFIPFLIILPVMTILIWMGIGRGLQPLKTTASDISNRTPANLQSISCTDIPHEVRPLIHALNKLFTRLRHALEGERRFTMDAAHELRTPLAAIKTQAQVALRAVDDHQKMQALEQIVSGVDRTSHLVRQLLVLARVDPDASIQEYEKLDLVALLSDAAEGMKPAADDKQITIHITTDSDRAWVLGQRQLLDALIRNLLDNAIRYSPRRSEVHCRIHASRKQARLIISDTGPGVPAEALKRMYDRFHRGMGTGQNGSGLGLSIVKRIAELHDAKIETRTRTEEDPGLTVELTFHLKPSLTA
jgi:two-component system sensor histidine kinase QseC